MTLIVNQLSLSTIEVEDNYFSGAVRLTSEPRTGVMMPSGLYRVVDGDLYRVATSPTVASKVAVTVPPQNERT